MTLAGLPCSSNALHGLNLAFVLNTAQYTSKATDTIVVLSEQLQTSPALAAALMLETMESLYVSIRQLMMTVPSGLMHLRTVRTQTHVLPFTIPIVLSTMQTLVKQVLGTS
jgi:hypothetical protein